MANTLIVHLWPLLEILRHTFSLESVRKLASNQFLRFWYSNSCSRIIIFHCRISLILRSFWPICLLMRSSKRQGWWSTSKWWAAQQTWDGQLKKVDNIKPISPQANILSGFIMWSDGSGWRDIHAVKNMIFQIYLDVTPALRERGPTEGEHIGGEGGAWVQAQMPVDFLSINCRECR